MKISILSAVHNEARFLPEMIASVQSQSYRAWELVFVSDGSSDGTDTLIQRYAEDDPRIRYVGHNEKIGKVAAFNLAFDSSRGDLVALLAGDDTLPEGSLQLRVEGMGGCDPASANVVAYFKLRTMSEDRKSDGLVLPRGTGASRSGGTITLTRHLADQVFPIDPRLVSEDLWLTRASEAMASEIRQFSSVVLNYRIHSGNSNPRNRNFGEMSRGMGQRHLAWQILLESSRISFTPAQEQGLSDLAHLEWLRVAGKTGRIVFSRRARFSDRIAYAAMSNPALFALRRRFFKLLSGRRARSA